MLCLKMSFKIKFVQKSLYLGRASKNEIPQAFPDRKYRDFDFVKNIVPRVLNLTALAQKKPIKAHII